MLEASIGTDGEEEHGGGVSGLGAAGALVRFGNAGTKTFPVRLPCGGFDADRGHELHPLLGGDGLPPDQFAIAPGAGSSSNSVTAKIARFRGSLVGLYAVTRRRRCRGADEGLDNHFVERHARPWLPDPPPGLPGHADGAVHSEGGDQARGAGGRFWPESRAMGTSIRAKMRWFSSTRARCTTARSMNSKLWQTTWAS